MAKFDITLRSWRRMLFAAALVAVVGNARVTSAAPVSVKPCQNDRYMVRVLAATLPSGARPTLMTTNSKFEALVEDPIAGSNHILTPNGAVRRSNIFTAGLPPGGFSVGEVKAMNGLGNAVGPIGVSPTPGTFFSHAFFYERATGITNDLHLSSAPSSFFRRYSDSESVALSESNITLVQLSNPANPGGARPAALLRLGNGQEVPIDPTSVSNGISLEASSMNEFGMVTGAIQLTSPFDVRPFIFDRALGVIVLPRACPSCSVSQGFGIDSNGNVSGFAISPGPPQVEYLFTWSPSTGFRLRDVTGQISGVHNGTQSTRGTLLVLGTSGEAMIFRSGALLSVRSLLVSSTGVARVDGYDLNAKDHLLAELVGASGLRTPVILEPTC